jgi:hypothetical protein
VNCCFCSLTPRILWATSRQLEVSNAGIYIFLFQLPSDFILFVTTPTEHEYAKCLKKIKNIPYTVFKFLVMCSSVTLKSAGLIFHLSTYDTYPSLTSETDMQSKSYYQKYLGISRLENLCIGMVKVSLLQTMEAHTVARG